MENHQCEVCLTISTLRCSRCKSSWYCSTAHQRKHWKEGHKLQCTSIHVHDSKSMKKHPILQFSELQSTFIPSVDSIESNLLIILHGLGDDMHSFEGLAQSLNLPETCYLLLRGPHVLPYDMGYGWYESFEPSSGERIVPSMSEHRRTNSIATLCRPRLTRLIETLLSQCNWRSSRILFLGYFQGAQACIDYLCHTSKYRFGGMIAVGTSIMEEEMLLYSNDKKKQSEKSEKSKLSTPMILLDGRADNQQLALEMFRQEYYAAKESKLVRRIQYTHVEHATLKTKEEADDLMKFFAENLYQSKLDVDSMKPAVK